MVILRCTGPEQFFLERVVFPFELLSFQCPGKSDIKIWTHGLGGPELVESIQAQELLIETPTNPTNPTHPTHPTQLEHLPGSASDILRRVVTS